MPDYKNRPRDDSVIPLAGQAQSDHVGDHCDCGEHHRYYDGRVDGVLDAAHVAGCQPGFDGGQLGDDPLGAAGKAPGHEQLRVPDPVPPSVLPDCKQRQGQRQQPLNQWYHNNAPPKV